MSTASVYRLWATDGTLLYVGMSKDPAVRLKAHRAAGGWARHIASMTAEAPIDREEAVLRERRAIVDEEPVFNSHHSGFYLDYWDLRRRRDSELRRLDALREAVAS